MINTCTICNIRSDSIHSHHVIPQAYGGVDGPQVPLCGSCHTSVHAHAVYLIAFTRNGGTSKPKQFWTTGDLESAAIGYVTAIVKAAQSYEGPKTCKIVCNLDEETYNRLKMIQLDTAQSSLKKTLDFCINYVYNRNCNKIKKNQTNHQGW